MHALFKLINKKPNLFIKFWLNLSQTGVIDEVGNGVFPMRIISTPFSTPADGENYLGVLVSSS